MREINFHILFEKLLKSLWLPIVAFIFFAAQSSSAQITIAPVTWNVVGLNSNKVTVGPNVFPVGARICNTGGTAVFNVSANFVWDSANPYVNLDAGSTGNLTIGTLSVGGCVDSYFDVVVTRSPLAFNTARRFHITANVNGVSTVSTPMPREIYVEKLVSQARNKVVSIQGPTTVYVGQTYQYTIDATTSTDYRQLEAFLSLSNVVFRIRAINTTYSNPTGSTNNKFYADACGWQNNPLLTATYRTCVGPVNYPGGKVGGSIRTVYTVEIMSTGVTTASTLILDASGSSYHYNADYGQKVISITALPAPVPNIELNKSVNPSGTQFPGTELTYSISITNSGNASAGSLRLTDPDPSNTTLRLNTNTDFKVGSVTNTLGSSGLLVSVVYSNDNGASFTYTPVSGAGGAPAGFDRNVTHIRWNFTGNLSFVVPNNSASISFIVKIR